MGALEALETVPAQILRARAQGLLVGLRDGGAKLVTGVLHCDADDLASTKGARRLGAEPARPGPCAALR